MAFAIAFAAGQSLVRVPRLPGRHAGRRAAGHRPAVGHLILLPVTFGLNATQAVIMLAGIYYGSQYGGSTTSILMRIPGEASSVMTCIDGNAMAQQGPRRRRALHRRGRLMDRRHLRRHRAHRGGAAARDASRCSFGPPEYTALLVLGLIFLAYMSSTSLVRTLLMACLGLMFGMIGIDNMTGHFRYSFDLAELGDGIGIVPVAVGLFGLGEILSTPSNKVVGEVISPKLRELLPNRQEWRESTHADRARHACSASSSASFRARRISFRASSPMRWRSASPSIRRNSARARSPASPARKSANNAASTGAFVPMLALGIPTGPITAVLIGALMVHGVSVRPAARQRTSGRVLGLRRLDVCRQPDAARAQSAAGRRCS